MTNLGAKCVQVAGSKGAGMLLSRIAYWADKTKIKRDGYYWVVLPRDRWCEETALSTSGFDRAVATLKREDLIVSERHLLGNKTRSFMRLSQRAILRLGDLSGNTGSGVSGNTESDVSGNTENAKTYKGKEVKKGDKEKSLSGSFTPAGETVPGKTTLAGEDMKVSDILKAQQVKQKLHKPDTAKGFEYLWKSLMAEVYGKTMFTPFNGKQLGQLNKFKSACPLGKGADILEWAIRNWVKFVKQVELEKGIKGTPLYPDVGKLLLWVEIAVQMTLAHEKAAPALEQEASKVFSAAPSVQLTSPMADDDDDDDGTKPQSFEELLKLVGGDLLE